MSSPGRGHLDDGVLLGYLGGDVGTWSGVRARRHLGDCEQCRARSEELRSVVREFSMYWVARKAASAAAPGKWADIEFELRARERSQTVWRKVASAARRTSARRPWVIGIAVAAAAAPLWIAGGRLREAEPEPARQAHFAAAPAGSVRPAPIVPIPANRLVSAAGAPRVEPGNLELKAIAALHGIGADVSEPVDLHRSAEGLEVVATAVDAAREREIREALAPLPAVQLRFAHPERQAPALEPRTADAPADEGPQAIRAKLDEHLGPAEREALEGRALEQSAQLLARLHAIDDLDRRFPAEVRRGFTAEESKVLEQIRADHIGKAKESLADLQTVFESIGSVWGLAANRPAPGGAMLENGRRVDEAVGVLLGGAPSRRAPGELMGAATASLSWLRRALEAMR